jgi:beta-glucosidase
MCGDYTYPAMSYFWKMMDYKSEKPHIVKLLEGMQNHKPEGVNVMYSRGCDWTEEVETKYSELGDARAWEYNLLHRMVDSGEKADKQEALAMAKDADVIIAAVGENVMLCGENRDRQGLRLPGKQEQFVEELIKTGKPVVLVIFGGRAQVISGLAEKCAAIIQAWYPGEEGGNAVADILYGKISPSAKLSVSYPNVEINEPICYNYSAEKDARIAWPFGYGLSYTTFEYANLETPQEITTNDESFSLTFEVKNTGEVAADEVAQIYLSPTDQNQKIRPIQLQGFARISLKPGESKKVSVKMYTEQLGSYSNEGQRKWNILPGSYIIKIGASSQDIRLEQSVVLKGEPVQKPLREYYFSESSFLN